MGIGKVLGSISPLAGAITGKGVFGSGLAKLADSGLGPLVPASYLAQSARDKDRRRADAAAAAQEEANMQAKVRAISGMKKGGKVKKMAKGGSAASKRADGCATKGKTKGRFV